MGAYILLLQVSKRKEEDGSLAKEELNLLAKLIGTETTSTSKEFRYRIGVIRSEQLKIDTYFISTYF